MKETLNTPAEKTSYALGLDVASSLKKMPCEIDTASFVQAFEDVMNNAPLKLEQAEFEKVMTEFQANLQQAAQAQQEEAAAANRGIGEAFLKENATNADVTTTTSGLQYSIITEGEGPKPTETDTVTVHYSGTLIDGTKFDSSYDRGEPATFPLNGVIKGWTEGVQLMSVGSKYRFVIPSELAYGSRGAGQVIGPDSVLVFEVELLSIN